MCAGAGSWVFAPGVSLIVKTANDTRMNEGVDNNIIFACEDGDPSFWMLCLAPCYMPLRGRLGVPTSNK